MARDHFSHDYAWYATNRHQKFLVEAKPLGGSTLERLNAFPRNGLDQSQSMIFLSLLSL